MSSSMLELCPNDLSTLTPEELDTFRASIFRRTAIDMGVHKDDVIDMAHSSLTLANHFAKSNGKTCPACSTFKGLNEFHNDSAKPDAKHAYCKECRRA